MQHVVSGIPAFKAAKRILTTPAPKNFLKQFNFVLKIYLLNDVYIVNYKFDNNKIKITKNAENRNIKLSNNIK